MQYSGDSRIRHRGSGESGSAGSPTAHARRSNRASTAGSPGPSTTRETMVNGTDTIAHTPEMFYHSSGGEVEEYSASLALDDDTRRRLIRQGKQRGQPDPHTVDEELSALLEKAEERRRTAGRPPETQSPFKVVGSSSKWISRQKDRGETPPDEVACCSRGFAPPEVTLKHETYERLMDEGSQALSRHADAGTGRALAQAMDKLWYWRYDAHARDANAYLEKRVTEATARHRKYVELSDRSTGDLIQEAQTLLLVWGDRDFTDKLKTSLACLTSLHGAGTTSEQYKTAEMTLRLAVTDLALRTRDEEDQSSEATPLDAGCSSHQVGPASAELWSPTPGSLPYGVRLPEDPFERHTGSLGLSFMALRHMGPYG